MFFIEPLVWMFKTPNFKQHFFKLIGISFLFWILLFILSIFTKNLSTGSDLLSMILIGIAALVLIVLPYLLITGYFWCLTDNIIDRDLDADVNSIYDGRSAKFKNVITLPEWDVPRFIWRGFAAIIATIILCIPFVELCALYLLNQSEISNFWAINTTYASGLLVILILLSGILVPALLWNYARRDSVVAVLNIPKAIYIIGTYTGKYITNAFLFVLYSILQLFLLTGIIMLFGQSIPEVGSLNNLMSILAESSSGLSINVVILNIVGFIICLYRLFVDAYLLGTIAPPSEY